MNIIFRNKLTGMKINLQDFFHKNENENFQRNDIEIWNSVKNKSLVPTSTITYDKYSLDDILLSNEWEIWSDTFWINEEQIKKLRIIISELFMINNPEISTIANKILEFINYNKMIEKKGGMKNYE